MSEDDLDALRSALNRSTARSVGSECTERVQRLEENMESLAKSVKDLQSIVEGQTEVLQKLHSRLSSLETQNGTSQAPPAN